MHLPPGCAVGTGGAGAFALRPTGREVAAAMPRWSEGGPHDGHLSLQVPSSFIPGRGPGEDPGGGTQLPELQCEKAFYPMYN